MTSKRIPRRLQATLLALSVVLILETLAAVSVQHPKAWVDVALVVTL